MSVTLKKDTWKIKDPNTGEYRDSTVFASTFAEDTADIVTEATAAIDAQETRAAGIVSGAQADIDTIAAAVQSMTQTGTDTTLTVSGAAADAAVVGELKTAFAEVTTAIADEDTNLTWQQGGINANNGKNQTAENRLRSTGFQSYKTASLIRVTCPSGYKFGIREFNDNTGSQDTHFVRSVPTGSNFNTGIVQFEPNQNYYYRFVLVLENDAAILPTEAPTDFTVEVIENRKTADVFSKMFTSNVGNSGILCAKEHHFVDGSSPIYEYFLLGDPKTNDVYYSKDLEQKTYLFTFNDTLGYWSFGIDANNNIICCKQSEYLASSLAHDDSLRVNPIVYLASEQYTTPHEVDFGSNLKPCGWLSSFGFICLANGDCLIGEYTRPVVQTANIWKISGDPSVASNWSIKQTFTLSGSDDGFKHIHCVLQDHYTGVCYFGTGDDDTSSHIYYSTDNGSTWTAGKENSEKYCRFLNIIFTDDYAYWATDSNKENYHWIFRVARDANGIIDFQNISDLLEIPLVAGLATYGCAYFPEYKALLLLERCDGARQMTAPVRLYDITTNTLHTIYTLETVQSLGGFLGFRTRFAQCYPKDGEANVGWHLRGTSLGSIGINENKMFGNQQSTGDTTRTVNNACLRVVKDNSTYRLILNTRYI